MASPEIEQDRFMQDPAHVMATGFVLEQLLQGSTPQEASRILATTSLMASVPQEKRSIVTVMATNRAQEFKQEIMKLRGTV